MSGREKEKRPAEGPLEIVIKCDTAGVVDAVRQAIAAELGERVAVIGAGVGPVNQGDLLTAETGSRLVLGFNVPVLPHVDAVCRERKVEVRLYRVIYRLVADLAELVASLQPAADSETVLGRARVIALFKSSRHGIILGCGVESGRLALGDRFRVIGAMGEIYNGRIESLHIERDRVDKAAAGQQAGIKIRAFDRARVGDLVEAYAVVRARNRPWRPGGEVLHR